MSFESGRIVRDALTTWLTTLNLGPAPERASADLPTPGEVPGLHHVGVAWGAVTGSHERLVAVSAPEGAPATWFAGYDEVPVRFVLRSNDAEVADQFAADFRARFALEAMRSNDGGDPVLHFDVRLGGDTRVGKVYLDGTYNPPQPKDAVERSLYEQTVGGVVVFPRYVVEEIGDETGVMTVDVSINGVAYALPEET